jgi:hypothetical protein
MREWPRGDVVGRADCEDRERRQEREEDSYPGAHPFAAIPGETGPPHHHNLFLSAQNETVNSPGVLPSTAGFDVAIAIGRWLRFAQIDRRPIVLPAHEF